MGQRFIMKHRRIKKIIFLIVYRIYTFIFMLLNKRKQKNILVLYLYADKIKYRDSYNVLMSILSNLHGMKVTIVKIDNFNEEKPHHRIDDCTYDISGDNSSWEFSGWDKGMDFFKSNIYANNVDTVLYVNDAFLNDSAHDELYYMMRYNTLTLYKLKNAVIGKVDCANEKMILNNSSVNRWVRSNFIAVPYSIASVIKLSHFSENNVSDIICDDFSKKIFKENSPMNDNLKCFLKYWILEGWPQAKDFNQENWPLIRGKIIAILNERLLSVKFCQHKLRMIDAKNNYVFSIKSLLKLINE